MEESRLTIAGSLTGLTRSDAREVWEIDTSNKPDVMTDCRRITSLKIYSRLTYDGVVWHSRSSSRARISKAAFRSPACAINRKRVSVS